MDVLKLIISLSFFASIGQSFAQTNLQLQLRSNWDNDDLPALSDSIYYNDCWGYAANGREYAILGSTTMIHFFDVTDPTTPILIDEFTGGKQTAWRDMKTYQHYAYAISEEKEEGLIIFDLSHLPGFVDKVNQTNEFLDEAHNIFIDEATGRLYAVGSTSNLRVYDVKSNPKNPPLLIETNLPGETAHDVHVRHNIMYASHLFMGLYIYDVSDLQNIVTLGVLKEYPGGRVNHSSWLSEDGTQLVFCDEKHGAPVKLLDLSDLSDLLISEDDFFSSTLLAPAHTNSIAHNPFVKGNLAFIAYYHDGIQVFDIADPDNIRWVAGYDTFDNSDYSGFSGAWGVYPFLPSGNIIASDIQNGLFIFSLKEIPQQAPSGEFDYQLRPNLVSDHFNVYFQYLDAPLHVRMYAADGKLVYKKDYNNGGLDEFEVRMDGFAAGVYVFTFNGKSKKLVKR